MLPRAEILLSYSFRPFFSLAASFAVIGMAAWLGALHGLTAPLSVAWHAHEMLLGFGGAAVAGFVLTAVATWTGRPPVNGRLLATLGLAWLLGRLCLYAATSLPWAVVMLADLLFPVLLAALTVREIASARNRRNYVVAAWAWLLAGLVLAYHLGAGGVWPGGEAVATTLLVHLLTGFVTLVGGRVVPSFTANWLRARGVRRLPASMPLVERWVLPLTLAAGAADGLAGGTRLTAGLAFAAALAHGLRLAGWRGLATHREPLVLVLHAAYAWLPLGYLALGLGALGLPVARAAALHALTVGAIGGMILAMMSRVALGHTGRPLHAARLTVLAYLALGCAALLRTVGPMVGAPPIVMDLAALAWIAAFLAFAVTYLPILVAPRIDQATARGSSAT